MLKVNLEQLEENIKKTILKAAEFNSNHGGEVQLYGLHDGERIYEFFTSVFSGHNSWMEGENIVRLFTQEWFDPVDHWDWNVELQHELDGDQELLEMFRKALSEEDIKEYSWANFLNFFPSKADEIMQKWKEIALNDEIIPLKVMEVIDRLEKCKEICVENG